MYLPAGLAALMQAISAGVQEAPDALLQEFSTAWRRHTEGSVSAWTPHTNKPGIAEIRVLGARLSIVRAGLHVTLPRRQRRSL